MYLKLKLLPPDVPSMYDRQKQDDVDHTEAFDYGKLTKVINSFTVTDDLLPLLLEVLFQVFSFTFSGSIWFIYFHFIFVLSRLDLIRLQFNIRLTDLRYGENPRYLSPTRTLLRSHVQLR